MKADKNSPNNANLAEHVAFTTGLYIHLNFATDCNFVRQIKLSVQSSFHWLGIVALYGIYIRISILSECHNGFANCPAQVCIRLCRLVVIFSLQESVVSGQRGQNADP